jgi:RNA polymerase sigma factor (sigma-70 family)
MTRSEYGRAYELGFRSTVSFLASRGCPFFDAEEFAQAAWTRGWERIDQLRDRHVLGTWVNSIALNLYRRSMNSDNRTQPLDDIARHADLRDTEIDLSRLLDSCCPSDRTVLLYYLDGLTTSEIARELGVTEIAARIRLTRARQSVRSITEVKKAQATAA